mmetsp:Transcript_63182/g.137389  ORF Transcript_63182/g.137389 Transcript_63182/m.137389 type:complete len:306 (+) Transcript_63182:463-1380(+)
MPYVSQRSGIRRQAERCLLRSEMLSDLAGHLHLLLHGLIRPGDDMRWVGRHCDALVLRLGPRKPLVDLLREVWQERVHQPARPIQAHIEDVAGNLPIFSHCLGLRLPIEAGLQQLQVDVAELIKEETVSGRCSACELIFLEGLICLLRAVAQPGQNPAVLPGHRRVEAQRARELVVAAKVHQTKTCRIPNLVAKVPIADHTVNVQVHISSLERIGQQPETQGIGATLWNTFWEIGLLTRLGLCNLLIRQVALLELLAQLLEADAINDLERVDDVTQALGHLPPVGIAHHGVKVDGVERELASETQ